VSDIGVSFGRRLSDLAAADPDRAAVVFVGRDGSEQPITVGHLDRRSNQVARALEAGGVGQDHIVAVGLGNVPEHLYGTFGAWKTGASVVPLRHDLPPWEATRLLQVAAPKAVFADWPDVDHDVLPRSWVGATCGDDDQPLPDRTPSVASMIATSGSTGHPKIVVVPNPGVYLAEEAGGQLVPPPGSVFLTTCPMYHANGFRFCYPPILSANKVVLMEKFDAALAMQLIEKHRVTHSTMVPTMLQRILRLDNVRGYDLSSIEQIIYGAAPIPEWVVRGWLELIPPERFLLVYGSSENVGIVATDGAHWLSHPGTAGRPLDCDVKIVDADYQEVAAGEVGDIYLRPLKGDTTPFRYLGQETPAPTADGYWTMGDMGRVDDEGFVYIADRHKDMIISGGANVYPAEVELALSEHPGIADSVIIGLPDPEWGQRVHAVIQPAPGTHPDEGEIRSYLKQRLASYKVPKTFEFTRSLPRTSVGKINRSQLVDERVAGADRATSLPDLS
jgi:bile acid-coenzyme A ligase